MQQNCPGGQYAATMYSIYRLHLDYKLYASDQEKAQIEQKLQHFEDLFLQSDDASILTELGIPPTITGGIPPPPAF